MRTRDIRPGMRGYGLTVFKGTRVERFPVEVLGVVRSYLAGSDLILIRVTGGYLARHGVGIVAGMSGSPVYVNGRLIGAIGYGWPFSKEPIGGVTPIESMIRDAAPQVASRGKTPAAPRMEARRLAKPIRVGKRTMRSVQIFSAADPDVKRLPKDVLALSPVPSLFQLRGFGERSAAGLEKVLRPLGMEPVRTFSVAATVPRRIPRLGPGAAVGVQLLSGDLEISGTGTLTWIDGKRFLAFGHPLANLGSVRLPFTAAYVQDILPSYQRPFKFATQIGVVGEMAEDRFFGVGGWFGRPSPLIPVRLSLHDGRGLNRTYNLRAAQHQTLAPVVMAQAMMEAMASTIPVAAETTALMKVRIKARGHEAVSFEQMVGGLQLDSSVGLQLFDALSALANNDFAPLFFEQVEVDVSLRAGRQVATIERVYTTRNAYRRGERIDVHVVLKPYDKPTLEKVVTLPIPADTDRGAITIGVAGGADMPALRKRLGQPKPEPNDVDQLLRQLQSQERNQEVVVRATFPTKAAVVNEERFVFLPDALRELLPGMAQSGIGAEKDFVDVRLSTDWVIRGADVVQADVAGAPESQEKGKTVPRGDYVMTPMVVMPTTPTTSPKAAPSEPKRAAGAPVEKTLPTGTRRFDLAGGKVFEQGRFEGTGLSPSGELALASQAAMTPSLDGAFLWTILREPEGTALAGASGGKVVRIDPARGTTSQIAHFPDAAVTALARDNRGTLWAGTSPNGFVYAGGRRVFSAPASYVWALLPDGEGMLAATGNPGRVYRVTAAGAKLQVEVPARHVRALMRTPDGALLAATGGPGTVYRVKDSLETLFVSPYGSVDALARAGDLVAAASGKNVYLIGNGEVRPLLVADKPLLALAAMDDGTLLASGGGGSVYRADLEGGVWRVADLDASAVTALAAMPDGGALAVAGGPGALARLQPSAAGAGTWTSDVLDAGGAAKWGQLRWIGRGTVTVQTRSGITPVPDGSWSAWSSEYTRQQGQTVASPPGRFLQVRVRMAPQGDIPPRVAAVNVFFRGEKRLPAVAFDKPQGGERWAGSQKVTWKVAGASPESLLYKLSCSADGGKTFKDVAANLPPTLKEVALAAEKEAAPQTEEYSWDTRKVPDGEYVLRIEVLDRTEPSAPVRASATSGPFLVSNAAPTVSVLGHEKSGGEATVIRGLAKARLAWIVSVTYRQGPKGEWMVAEPEDGMFDSDRETFRIVIRTAGDVEVKVVDEAGNTATTTVSP